MAVPGSGEVHMKGLHNEKVNDDYNNASDPGGAVTMHDLVNGGNSQGSAVSYEATNTSGDNEPNTSTPHAFNEWYSYDHDFVAGQPSIPTITYTQPSNSTINLVLNWAMDGINQRVYFYATGAEILIKFNGDTYKTSAGSVNYSDTNHTFIGYSVYGAAVGPNDTFSVRAKGYYDGTFSDYSSAITGYTLPGTPSFTSLSQTTTSMEVGWSAPTGGVNSTNGYRYYFGTDSTVTNNTAYDQSGTSKTVSGLTPNQIYYAAIQAKGDGGHFGAISSTASNYTQAATPSNLTGTSITATSMVLGWTAGAGNAPTSYTIYFGTNPSSSGGSGNSTISGISGGSTSYTKTSLQSNNTYYFFIRAVADTNSTVSSVSSAFLTKPASVTAITVNSFTSTTANISWTHDVGGGDETITYTVKTGTSSTYANSSTNITTSGTTTGTITGLSENNTNRIWVVATNSAGSAAEFGPVSFETRMAPPASISFSSVTTTSMTVNWTNSAIGDLEDGDATQVRFGTNSNHASNTLYTVDSDVFTRSFTGLTAGTQHYVSVAGFSEYGIVGDAATDNQQTSVNTSWGNITNFTIEAQIGSSNVGHTKQITLTNSTTGNTTIALTDLAGSVFGALAVAASFHETPNTSGAVSVPGVSTGWITTNSSATLTTSQTSSQTLYFRFKFQAASSGGSDTRRLRLTHNNIVDDTTITIVSVDPGRSDRRLKTDIKFIKNSPSGIPIYQFRFKESVGVSGLFQGTTAQDLLELGMDNVVSTDENGWYTVDYDKIDVEAKQIVDN